MKFRQRNRKTIIFLDILMILAVLSNAGAYAITKVLAIKNEPTAQIYETNPASIAMDKELAPPPQPARALIYLAFFLSFGKFIVLGIALGCYVYYRNRMNSDRQLLALSLGVGIWFTILFLDFSNNFGLWLGKILFGR